MRSATGSNSYTCQGGGMKMLLVVAGFGKDPFLLLTNLEGARDSESLG